MGSVGRGRAHDEEAKSRKISEARRRHFLEHPYPLPERKRCSKCGHIKNASEFYRYKRYIKAAGGFREYLRASCKECEHQRIASIKKSRKREYQRRANQKIKADPERSEKRRRQQREWAAQKRRKMGMKEVGPWKRYRDSAKGKSLPFKPFQEWLHEILKYRTTVEVASQAGVTQRQVRRWQIGMDGDKKIETIPEDTVDKVLMGFGQQDQMAILYPPDFD